MRRDYHYATGHGSNPVEGSQDGGQDVDIGSEDAKGKPRSVVGVC